MRSEIRTAGPEDAHALLALWEVAAENDSRPSDSAAAVERLLVRDPHACLVALVDRRIVDWRRWVKPVN